MVNKLYTKIIKCVSLLFYDIRVLYPALFQYAAGVLREGSVCFEFMALSLTMMPILRGCKARGGIHHASGQGGRGWQRVEAPAL